MKVQDDATFAPINRSVRPNNTVVMRLAKFALLYCYPPPCPGHRVVFIMFFISLRSLLALLCWPWLLLAWISLDSGPAEQAYIGTPPLQAYISAWPASPFCTLIFIAFLEPFLVAFLDVSALLFRHILRLAFHQKPYHFSDRF